MNMVEIVEWRPEKNHLTIILSFNIDVDVLARWPGPTTLCLQSKEGLKMWIYDRYIETKQHHFFCILS